VQKYPKRHTNEHAHEIRAGQRFRQAAAKKCLHSGGYEKASQYLTSVTFAATPSLVQKGSSKGSACLEVKHIALKRRKPKHTSSLLLAPNRHLGHIHIDLIAFDFQARH